MNFPCRFELKDDLTLIRIEGFPRVPDSCRDVLVEEVMMKTEGRFRVEKVNRGSGLDRPLQRIWIELSLTNRPGVRCSEYEWKQS